MFYWFRLSHHCKYRLKFSVTNRFVVGNLSPLLSISYGNQSLLTSSSVYLQRHISDTHILLCLRYLLFYKHNCFSFLWYRWSNVTYWLRSSEILVVFLLYAYRLVPIHCNNLLIRTLAKSVTKSTNPSIDSKPIFL
jgi:hypothetical protein